MSETDPTEEGQGEAKGEDAGSTGPGTEAVVDLAGSELATILSEAWTNRGWETDVAEDDDGTFLVTGDKGDGQRGLVLVLPGEVEVPGKRLQQYASLVKQKSVDVRVVATQGSFTDDAERIANANDVHLLDPPAVLETVEAEGLEETLSEFAADGVSGEDGGGIGAALSALPIPGGVPGSLPSVRPGGKGLKSVLLVVLIASSLLAGFAGGAFLGPSQGGAIAATLGDLGGVGGGGGAASDVAVASLSTAEPDSAGLTVRWNARTADSVTANGSTYEAPDGTMFLVVQYDVTNTGDERVPVKAGDFLVSANGSRYTHQPLDGSKTFELTALAPGNQTTGWAVYSIPSGTSDAVIVPNTDAPGGPIAFSRDASLEINGTA